MGKYERERGARFERMVAEILRKHGYEAERGCQHSGGKDSPDVKHNMGKYHLEAKFSEHFAVWSALAQAERDAGDDEVPIVVFKRNRSKVYAVLEFDELIEIIKKGQNNDDTYQITGSPRNED